MIALMGFLIIVALVYLVFMGKTSPVVAFALLPIAAALIAGFNIEEITEFVASGVGLTWQTAVLFIFSVTYFGIMNDVGLFDNTINRLLASSKNRVTAIYIVTALIAMIAQFDGSGATTFLITIPALLPIYIRLGLKPTSLLLIVAAAAGVMNYVPWGGSTTRAATVLGVSPNDLWMDLIPMQIVGLVLVLGLAIILPKIEKTKIDPKLANASGSFKLSFSEEELNLKRPKLVPLNALLTIFLLILLFTLPDVPLFLIFMIGVAIALPLNFRTLKEQNERIGAHAPAAMMMATILLSAGVLLGVMQESGMITDMAYAILSILPDSIGAYLHIIVAFLTAPIHLVIGTDPYYYGLLPIIIEIAEPFGVAARDVAIAMTIGESTTFAISAVVPSVWLAIGLAGVEYKDHLKYSFNYIWLLSIALVIAGILLGYISF